MNTPLLQLSDAINQNRHHKERESQAKHCARERTRNDGTCVKADPLGRHFECNGGKRCNESPSRRNSNRVQVAHERVDNHPEQKSKIHRRAPYTHAKLVAEQEERPLGTLMTHRLKEPIAILCQR